MTDDGALDQADMEELAAGEDRALDRLMDRHAALIHQFLYRMLGNDEDASELAQEAFVRVYQHRRRFRKGARFKTWLYAIAANLGRNQLRWRARHPATSLDAPAGSTDVPLCQTIPHPAGTPAQLLESRERISAVRHAVEALSEELRESLVLCEWEGLAVAEAAEIVGATTKAVESRLYRARKQLREELTSRLGEI